jgi:hypothetical protein
MKLPISLFEIVKYKNDMKSVLIYDFDYRSDGTIIYILRSLHGGNDIMATEEEFEPTGVFGAPFQYYEVVSLGKKDDLNTYERGVIIGISFNSQGEWDFSVMLISGECVMFAAKDLYKTDRILSEKEKSFFEGDHVTVYVDPISGEGSSSDDSAIDYLYSLKPLPFRL